MYKSLPVYLCFLCYAISTFGQSIQSPEVTKVTGSIMHRGGGVQSAGEKSFSRFSELNSKNQKTKKSTSKPAARELRKAKNQLAANFYRQLQTISGKAQLLGTSDVHFGDPKEILQIVPRYEAVAAADIQRLAREYFKQSNRTVSILVPETEAIEPPGAATGKGAGS